MAVTALVYGNALIHFLDADIDWTADTIKVKLCSSSYTPSQDNDDFDDDATNEITGTNYTAGGGTLDNPTRTYTGATNTLMLDADDEAWASASFTARYAVIYKDRGGAANADELISYVNFGGDETVSSGTFTLQWDSAGLITATVA